MHWEDMRQTAVLTFLEHADKNTGYTYAAARMALKNYTWVHIRGLNGGWNSLACIENGYTVLDLASELDEDGDMPRATMDRLAAKTWDAAPRSVEWEVMRRLSPPGATQEKIVREVLYIYDDMVIAIALHGDYAVVLDNAGMAPSELVEKIKLETKKGTSDSACTPCAQSGSDGI